MPSAITAAVADAVLKELQQTTLTLSPSYSRTEDTDVQLKDVGVLHVDVVAAGHQVVALTRSRKERRPRVHIAVRKRLDNNQRSDDLAEQDRLRLLVEEIEDVFFQRRLDVYPAIWESTETSGPSEAHYRTWRQFTAVITMTFRVFDEV